MALFRVAALPDSALTAAATFHAEILPHLPSGDDTLTLVFTPAGPSHRAWRLALVQALAREQAPRRVNALVGDDEAAIRQAATFLETAAAITGQLLMLDGAGSNPVVSSAA